jgi:hypothetical protein
MDDGDKLSEIVSGEIKIFCTGLTGDAKAGQKSLVPVRQANEPTKEGPLSIVLIESPFASFSTVGRGYPTLVSLTYPFPRFNHSM